LHLLAEFGAIEQLRFPTFTTAIIAQYESTFASTAANLLALVLLACCLGFVTLEVLARGRRRMSTVGSGAARPATKVRLGWRVGPAIVALLGVAALALGVPAYSIRRWLVFGGTDAWHADEMISALTSTLELSALAALTAVVLGFPVAWLAVRYRGALTTTLERTTYLASSLPGVVVGLALVTAAIHYARPFYQTTPLLIAAYAMLFLPRAMVSLRTAIGQAPPNLEDAARALGAPGISVFRRVVLPLTAPGVVTGLALVFLAVTTELTATLLLAPTGTHTLATQFWAATSEIDYPTAAPYALMLVLLSLPATFLLLRQARRVTSR
jgi:iron(III) transport system permease protein